MKGCGALRSPKLVHEHGHLFTFLADEGGKIQKPIVIEIERRHMDRARSRVHYFRFESRGLALLGDVPEHACVTRAIESEYGHEQIQVAILVEIA